MFKRLIQRRKSMIALLGSACFTGASVLWFQVKDVHRGLSFKAGEAYDNQIQRLTQLYSWERSEDPSTNVYTNSLELMLAWIEIHTGSVKQLIELSKSNNPTVRNLAVKALAEAKDWADADFRKVAKLCDGRTVVGLARTHHADERLFAKPPPVEPTEEILEDQLRVFLSQLPVHDVDKCTRYFTSSALVEGKRPSEERDMVWSFDGNGYAMAKTVPLMPSDFRIELFCLHAIFTHSTNLAHCPEIVRLGGLTLLRRICESRSHSIKVMRNAARILANLTICEQLHPTIISNGWVSILRNWVASPDLALSLNASKALANMDRDSNERKYHDGVYLYHPQYRSSDPVLVDVVFVHGLLGGPFRTWRQQDPEKVKKNKNTQATQVQTEAGMSVQPTSILPSVIADSPPPPYTFCWPKDWLAKDLPNVRILTVEYETHLTEWAPKCPFESEKRSLAVRSKDMLLKLRRAGLGDRPIIWVGHSMGGLLIKKMLTLAVDDPSMSEVVDKTHGIVFYGVPHRGSTLAGYSRQTKYLLSPSIEVKELAPGSEMLRRLHTTFTELMFERGIPLLSFGEGKKTELPLNIKQTLVPQESSDPGFGEYHLMEDMNHLEVCKPRDRFSPIYVLTLDFMLDCLPHRLMQHTLHSAVHDQGIDDFILDVLS